MHELIDVWRIVEIAWVPLCLAVIDVHAESLGMEAEAALSADGTQSGFAGFLQLR